MKEVYIPTEEELYNLQLIGVNIYNYILAKVIETAIIKDVVHDEEDIFDTAYEELHEFPEIIYTMCRMYPERISSSIITSKDVDLCRILTQNIPSLDKSIYYLDNLAQFAQEPSILFDSIVVENVTKILVDKLLSCPKYRFDYNDNLLLDSIFSCELPLSNITSVAREHLMTIDPIYTIKLGNIETTKKGKSKQEALFALKRNILRYSARFGLSEQSGRQYQNKDIITNQDEKIKKLVKYLNEHRENSL